MFRFLKSCKVKNKALNEIEANLKIAVEHLDQGQEYYLPVIYQCLVSKDADVARFAANAISKHMRNLNTAEIINLNDQFRQYSSMEWYICWNERTPTQSVRGIVRSAKELHSGLIPFISPQRGGVLNPRHE
ncbi:MAG: hypothetical protein IKK38_02450 [Spirochaetaceae bacterium]|nr:hypothetical protein [Spirochaetaceae bacterium]